jgi:hypothetical protein
LAGIKEDPAFGFEPFPTPKHGLPHRICHFAPGKGKNLSFIDIQKASTKWIPGPIYVPHEDWRKTSASTKGKFGKYQKITFTNEVFTK